MSNVKAQAGFLERTFKLNEHKTNVKTEILAGITTFMTMAYILAVNPDLLSKANMDAGGVFTATAISAALATLIMAFAANYPFVLAPGMGLNAYFAFTVCGIMGYSWEFALTAVFIEGIIFILMSFVNVREAIVNAIPLNLKNAVSAGIGLFIAFIGFQGSGIIVGDGATLVKIGELTQPTAIVAILGIIITGILLHKKVKGAILIGILASTVIGIPLGVTKLPTSFFSLPPSLAPVAFKLDFANIFTLDMLVVVFTFLFVDVFDTIGTLVGVASKANMLDEKGTLPKVKPALFADAVGTTAGALLGTSTVTTFVESASGVSEGGRTGLTALTSAVLFILALFLFPIFGMIPSAATAPALILVGLAMMSSVLKVNFDDYTEAIPAFLAIIMMPIAYSIAEGIVFGMVSYTVLKLIAGKGKEVSPVVYILSVLFILKYIFL